MLNKQTKTDKPKGQAADLQTTQAGPPESRNFEAPATRPVKPLPEGKKHDHLAEREASAEDRQEALLDEAIEETVPGSDPISPKHIT